MEIYKNSLNCLENNEFFGDWGMVHVARSPEWETHGGAELTTSTEQRKVKDERSFGVVNLRLTETGYWNFFLSFSSIPSFIGQPIIRSFGGHFSNKRLILIGMRCGGGWAQRLTRVNLRLFCVIADRSAEAETTRFPCHYPPDMLL